MMVGCWAITTSGFSRLALWKLRPAPWWSRRARGRSGPGTWPTVRLSYWVCPPPSPIADMVALNTADQVVVLTLHKDGELRRTTLGASDPARILASGRTASEGIWLIWTQAAAVVTVSQSHVVEVLSPEDGQLAEFKPISAVGRGVLTAGNADGWALLVTATEGERAEVPTTEMTTWDMTTGIPVGPPLRPTEHFPDRKWPATIISADITERDGKPAVLMGSFSGPVAMWDPVRGELIDEPYEPCYEGGGGAVFGVLAIRTRDSDFQCWGDADGNLFMRAAGASEPRRFVAHDSGLRPMTTCRLDGDTVIVTGGRDGAVRVWKPGDAKPAAYRVTAKAWWSCPRLITVSP